MDGQRRSLQSHSRGDGQELCTLESLRYERKKTQTNKQQKLTNLGRQILRNVCSAIAFLHQHNIAHRDIKSPNVLLTHEWEAKLSDFGSASVANAVRSVGFVWWWFIPDALVILLHSSVYFSFIFLFVIHSPRPNTPSASRSRAWNSTMGEL